MPVVPALAPCVPVRPVPLGKTDKFTYIVMARVGRELTELRRRQPDKRLSLVSALRVGTQSLQAIGDLHAAGFIVGVCLELAQLTTVL